MNKLLKGTVIRLFPSDTHRRDCKIIEVLSHGIIVEITRSETNIYPEGGIYYFSFQGLIFEILKDE